MMFLSSKIYRPVTGFLAGVSLALLFAFYQNEDLPACIINCDRWSDFYIGVDNPLTVLVRGIPFQKIRVTGSGVEIKNNGNTKYTAKVNQPGPVSITVTDGEKFTQTFHFKARAIPDPIPLLGARHRSKTMGNGEFKAQSGIAAVIGCCGFDARCEVVEYAVLRWGRDAPRKVLLNQGARFVPAVRELVDLARPGDQYFFDGIMARCPGDKHPRDLGTLSFKIK